MNRRDDDSKAPNNATARRADEEPDRPAEVLKPIWRPVLRRSVKQFRHDDISDRAAALTYFGVLAVFPAVLVLVSLLGLAGQARIDSVLNNLRTVTPGGVHSFLRSMLTQIEGRSSSAGIALIVGVLVALWSASGYVAAFMRASNAIYDVDEGRPVTRTVPVRLGVTVALVIMLVVSALMVVLTGPFARTVGDALGMGSAAVRVWDIAKWPVLLIVVSLMFSLLYWAAPNVKQPGFRWITPGGVIALVLWMIASGAFAVYLGFSGSYNKTYGSFAGIIIFLVWLWITNVAILLGAEFNAELERERLILRGMPEDVEPYAELRDTRKLDDYEKRRVEAAQRAREKALDGRARSRSD